MQNSITKNLFEKQDTEFLLAQMRQRVKLLEAMLLKLYGENIHTDKPLKTEVAPFNPPDLNVSFDDFWNLYDKKVGNKETLQKKWSKLKDQERTAIMAYIPRNKLDQIDKQNRKSPETFLNQRSWEDEIIGEVTHTNDELGSKQEVVVAP